ncbi:uncharacterized protein [Amphiura filiformis]|uniref:uncharacterized protein isoform X2 n=1 Tax=Amphiura filiformis TaxID=82378 RepID=UPI003B21FE25
MTYNGSILEPNQSIDIIEGDVCNISCSVTANPAANVTLDIEYLSHNLLSQSNSVVDDTSVPLLHNTTAHLQATFSRNPRTSSTGTITCTAVNPDNSSQVNVNVNVFGGPDLHFLRNSNEEMISRDTTTVAVAINTNTSLYCLTRNSIPAATIAWSINDDINIVPADSYVRASGYAFNTVSRVDIDVILPTNGSVVQCIAVNPETGSRSEISVTLIITDTENPIFTNTPGNLTQNTDPGLPTAAVFWTEPSVSDNSGMSSSLTVDYMSGYNFTIGVTIVTYTAVDPFSNTATYSFVVTVIDDEDPLFSNVVTSINTTTSTGFAYANVTWIEPTVTDNSGHVTLASNYQPGDKFYIGDTRVTYNATDPDGNTAAISFVVSVIDMENATFSNAPDDIVTNTSYGQPYASVTWVSPTILENSGVHTLTSDYNPGDNFTIGVTLVTYMASDSSDNVAVHTFTITVLDNESPSISGLPANINQSTDVGLATAVVTWSEPTASDNSGSVTFSSSHSSGDTFSIGDTIISYTATDAASNQVQDIFTVTIRDHEKPVFTSSWANITADVGAKFTYAFVSWTDPYATDNSGSLNLTSNYQPGEQFPIGDTIVMYTATDMSGNSEVFSFIVTVNVVGCPSGWTYFNEHCYLESTETVDFEDASHACMMLKSNVVIINDQDENDALSPLILSDPALTSYWIGLTDITTEDTFVWLDGTIARENGVDYLYTNFQPGEPNNAGNEDCMVITAATRPGYFLGGWNDVRCTVVRGYICEMSGVASAVFSNTPADVLVNSSKTQATAIVTWTPPTVANHTEFFTVTATHNPEDSFPIGVTSVIYTATDSSGYQFTVSFSVTVQDVENPIITNAPSNITSYTDPGQPTASIIWIEPNVTDNSGVFDMTSNFVPGDDFVIGDTVVIISVTDPSSNMATYAFTVTVIDNETPVLVLSTNLIESDADPTKATTSITWTLPTVEDNSGSYTLTSTHSPGDEFPIGETYVVYLAIDAAGNSASSTILVTVTDNVDPVFAIVSDVIATAGANEITASVTWDDPVVNDNSGIWSLTSNYDPGDTFSIGETEVTYTAVDPYGNIATTLFTVTVQDFDECASNATNDCIPGTICNDFIGSYTCVCPDGYQLQTSPIFGTLCLDANECVNASLNQCNDNAVCVNTDGGYMCICREEDNYVGDGITCTFVDPCNAQPCLNGGICTTDNATAVGYVCECATRWTGSNCNLMMQPIGPPSVVTQPTSQDIESFSTATFTVAFENIRQILWFKDNVEIVAGSDQTTLRVYRATAVDQGYYYATAFGSDGSIVNTNQVTLTLKDLDTFPIEATFDTPYVEANMTEIEASIETFVNDGLQNSEAFAGSNTPVATVVSTRPGSVIAEINMNFYNSSIISFTSFEGTRDTLTNAMVNMAKNSQGFLSESIIVKSTDVCFSFDWRTIYGEVTFETASTGETVNSTGVCPWYTNKEGEPIATATCEAVLFSVATFQPELNCGGNRTNDEILSKLDEVEVTTENVKEVTMQVEYLTQNVTEIKTDGIQSTANILQEVAALNTTDVEITQTFVDVIDHLHDVNQEYIQEAQDLNGAASRTIQALEMQLQRVELPANMSFRDVGTSVVVEVLDFSTDVLQRGLGFGAVDNNAQSSVTDNSMFVLWGSDELLARNDYETNADTLIVLPEDILTSVGSTNNDVDYDSVRVSFTMFDDSSLFISAAVNAFNENSDGTIFRRVNTRIMSCAIEDHKIENLKDPVRTYMKPLNDASKSTNHTCVFWDFDANNGKGDWSTDGCNLANFTSGTVICECNHLTNFAVLMDINSQATLTATQDKILEVLSYVGCSLSILGIIATTISYISNRKLRAKQPNKILLNLCCALLGLYIVFIVMIAVDTERYVAELGLISCSILAATLQYFTLASLAWMGIEGVNMYLLFIKVVDSYVQRFMLKACLFAWGLPAIVVGATIGATRENYLVEDRDFCFLQQVALIAGVLIPIAVIIIFNTVVFILVLRRLSARVPGRSRKLKRKHETRRRFMNALCILFLMGLTWSIGYLTIIGVTSFFTQLLFCVCNSMQGYAIFMLYVVRQPEAREVWTSTFRLRSSSRGAKSSSDFSSSRSNGTGAKSKPSTAGNYGKPIDATKLGYNNSVTAVNGQRLIANSIMSREAYNANHGNVNRGFNDVVEDDHENDSGIAQF